MTVAGDRQPPCGSTDFRLTGSTGHPILAVSSVAEIRLEVAGRAVFEERQQVATFALRAEFNRFAIRYSSDSINAADRPLSWH